MNLFHRILAWHYSRQASKLRLWAIKDYRSANKRARRLEWLAVRSKKLCSGRYLSGKGKGAEAACEPSRGFSTPSRTSINLPAIRRILGRVSIVQQ